MLNKSFSEKILLSITGEENIDWQNKLEEINELKIEEVAVFLTRFDKKERDNFYRFLLKSSIKSIPFVHIRNDNNKEDLKFFIDNYKTRYFNIHEDGFEYLDQWQGYWDKIYLEPNYNDEMAKDVKVKKIGGFCIDLAHLKSAIARGTKEASYVFSNKDKISFPCNHLGGYSEEAKQDLHSATHFKQFDYLATLPKFVFGDTIAIELDNTIKEQIMYKDYIVELLNNYFI
jgi:hypothetical protein